jgi:hypothetical protein
MLELTRGSIISDGLNRAGRPDLLSDGRLWLNQFLEDQYENQDWPFLIKTSKGLTVVQGGTIPTDYRSAVSATVGQTVANTKLVEFVPADKFHEFYERNNTDNSGTPEVIYVDESLRTFNYWPNPSSGLLLNLRYYYSPELPDHLDPTSDNEIPIWQAPKQILVQAMYVRALEYNDDARFEREDKRLFKMVNDHKMNSHDLRAGKHRLKWGKSFRPKRGRW